MVMTSEQAAAAAKKSWELRRARAVNPEGTVPPVKDMTPRKTAVQLKRARMERARSGALARWEEATRFQIDWASLPTEQINAKLTDVKACWDAGIAVLRKRTAYEGTQQSKVQCSNPGCPNQIDVSRGRWAAQASRRDPLTQMIYNDYWCSPACYQATGMKASPQYQHQQREQAEGRERKLPGQHILDPAAPTA